MTVTVSVAGTKSPTHHLSLSDGSTTMGLILPDGARSIQEIPYSPSSLKTSSGGTKYSDFEPPYAFLQQNDWSGGRGQEDFSGDPTQFYDSMNLWSMTPGFVCPAPQWNFGTGYRSADQVMPGNVGWTTLTGANLYLARSFAATVTSMDKCYFWIRRVGTPTGTLTFVLCNDNAGDPGTTIDSATVTTSTITDTVSVFYPFNPDSTETLVAATTYWVKIYDAGTPDASNYWQVGTSTTVGTTEKSADNSTWSAASVGLYFRLVGADTRQRWHFCEYKGALFGATEPADGTAGKLYINGDNGAADDNAADKTKLNDATKSWTTDEWANCVAAITDGPGFGEYRKIASNTGTALTVSTAWDTTHTTATNYVILGSSKWTERATTGLTKPVTDVAVSKDLLYMAQGNATLIRRHSEYNSTGTWTNNSYADEATAKADFIEVHYEGVAGPVVWIGSNSDASGNVSVARAPAVVMGNSLVPGTPIQVGDWSTKITGLTIYNNMLWVGKSNGLWYINEDVPEKLQVGFQAITSPENCQAMAALNLYLYVNWAHSVEQIYGSTVDDVGPWRYAGLPDGRTGVVSCLLPTMSWLFAGIDAGETGTSSVLCRSNGWHETFRAWETGRKVQSMFWQSVLGTPNRMWIGVGGDLVYQDFPRASLNPLKDSNMLFQHEAVLVSSWMTFGYDDLNKYIREDSLRSDGLSGSAVTVNLEYQTNSAVDSTAWTNVGAFSTSPQESQTINVGSIKRFRRRLRLLTTTASTPPAIAATVLKGIARGPVKYRWVLKIRLKDNATTLSGVRDHDPDTLLTQLKSWATNTTPLTMRAIGALSALDNVAVFIEPPSTAREYINKVMGFFGGQATFEVKQA